jgi:hypothetical protein
LGCRRKRGRCWREVIVGESSEALHPDPEGWVMARMKEKGEETGGRKALCCILGMLALRSGDISLILVVDNWSCLELWFVCFLQNPSWLVPGD